jgi:hypothetical protein
MNIPNLIFFAIAQVYELGIIFYKENVYIK